MCTAISFNASSHYFGRNLDLEFSYHEQVTITPRQFPFQFRKVPTLNHHHAIIGMAYIANEYPLYYDATNEKGLSMAGLNFAGNACYYPEMEGKDNITPFEFIPWILGQCATVDEACQLLSTINLLNENFSDQLPLSPLHWLIADKTTSIVVESLKDGMKIYENPVGALTNNPTFDIQLFNLNQYINLSAERPNAQFAKSYSLNEYSRGMGALGLPGDLSSSSRFAKVVFTKENSLPTTTEEESVCQFFHILGSVTQQKGCVHLGGNNYEFTIYSSCCNTDRGIYYYTTYNNQQPTAIDMHHENLDEHALIAYPLLTATAIHYQN